MVFLSCGGKLKDNRWYGSVGFNLTLPLCAERYSMPWWRHKTKQYRQLKNLPPFHQFSFKEEAEPTHCCSYLQSE